MSVTDAKGSSHSEPRDQLQQLQDDVATLRQQTATALRLLAAILSTMKDLTRREGNIEHGIAELSHEIDGMLMPHPPPPETCPSCGSPLDRHQAPSGDLCICSACGWSQFVELRGAGLTPALPGIAPHAESAAMPTPWVAN